MLTKERMRDVAAALGHSDLSITQTPRGLWIFTCSCGVTSTLRMRSGDAASAAVHHLQQVIRQWETAGRPPLSAA